MKTVINITFVFLVMTLLSCGQETNVKKRVRSISSEQTTAESQESSCICTMNYDPVCGNDVTYSNACMAECKGVRDYTQGECSQ